MFCLIPTSKVSALVLYSSYHETLYYNYVYALGWNKFAFLYEACIKILELTTLCANRIVFPRTPWLVLYDGPSQTRGAAFLLYTAAHVLAESPKEKSFVEYIE